MQGRPSIRMLIVSCQSAGDRGSITCSFTMLHSPLAASDFDRWKQIWLKLVGLETVRAESCTGTSLTLACIFLRPAVVLHQICPLGLAFREEDCASRLSVSREEDPVTYL